jgi:hypothetical protein
MGIFEAGASIAGLANTAWQAKFREFLLFN